MLKLPVGTYQLEANSTGFKRSEQTGVVLDGNL
jgi:hypothetical protein